MQLSMDPLRQLGQESCGTRNRAGFTLIELLIVTTIIGIIATIAAVAFSSIRGKARIAAAQAGLKQLRTAFDLMNVSTGAYPGGGVLSLCENGIDLTLDSSSGIGPYINPSRDPWGNYFALDGDYQCGAATVGCQGINDPSTDSAVIYSKGPNGVGNYGNGDDVVHVACKR